MHYELGCTLAYTVQNETPFVFNIEAQKFGAQYVENEQLTVNPGLHVERWTMPESGNRYFRVIAPAGHLKIDYRASISWTPQIEDPDAIYEIPPSRLPLSVFPHLYPSRYCQPDKLERFARSTFGNLSPGYARVNGICNWIHDYVSYEGGVSDALTSAFDTVTQRAGVCRDFAHLAIALCRTLGDSGTLCQRLCLSARSARFPRRRRGPISKDRAAPAGICLIPHGSPIPRV